MKKLLSLALTAAIALCAVACEKAPESAAITKDRAGYDITLPAKAEKIISLAPAITQELCELGLADRIVAVDSQSPLYAEGLKSDIMQMDMLNPDQEQLVALAPDIIFVSTMSAAGGPDPFETVRNAGICVVSLPTSVSVADVGLDVQFIADCIGKTDEGKVLVDGMNETFKKIGDIGKKITEQKTVLFEISTAPQIYSCGSDVFLNEMITTVGAKNIMADQSGWIAVTEEAAVAANPDVILTNVNYIEDAVGEIKARNGWQEMNAVKNGAVAYIDNGTSSLPNHHIADALLQIAKAVYPDMYADIK